MSRSRVEAHADGRIISETANTYTVSCFGGHFKLVVHKDDESLTPCLIGKVGNAPGLWEAWITSWLTRWIRPGMTFIDVGANCGYYTMLAEKLVGRHGHVVAYEANPVYVELLRATREVNDASFSLRPIALSDKVGHVNLSVPGNLHGSASIRHDFSDSEWGAKNTEVRTTTLDNELQRLVFWNADVVKIDVEGAEELVWNGGRNLFHADGSHSTIMLEWTPGSYSLDFLEELFEWGYVFSIAHDGGEIPVNTDYVNALTDWDMLVVRRKG